jgi:flagellum-specific ATP synthase
MKKLAEIRSQVRNIPAREVVGRVCSMSGLELIGSGFGSTLRLGHHVCVANKVRGEVVGISEGRARILPFGTWDGISSGDEIRLLDARASVHPTKDWVGRVLDAFGEPIDEDSLPRGRTGYPVRSTPPDAFSRRSVGGKMETGVKGMDVFIPLCRGQRMGVFAGSGVGKSTLMGMLARQSDADIIVMGLVGERGREVRDFIEKELGPEGMARSVLIVATSDQPALMRREAAWTATAVAEFFRDQGKHVLLMVDSVTRFAMAQREIGLSAGEPPTSKGYTPTVFTELPRLLERSGPGSDSKGQGDITAIYTVLVDGDDLNEPIADSVRGVLDGHIVLDRKIAERGRYPAMDIQKSISRMLPHCHTFAEMSIMSRARSAMARYADMADLIRIGAYRKGTDPATDMDIAFAEKAEEFLSQDKHDRLSSVEAFATLYGLLSESGIEVPLE